MNANAHPVVNDLQLRSPAKVPNASPPDLAKATARSCVPQQPRSLGWPFQARLTLKKQSRKPAPEFAADSYSKRARFGPQHVEL